MISQFWRKGEIRMNGNDELQVDLRRSDLDATPQMLIPWKHRTTRNLAYAVVVAFVLALAVLLVGGLALLASRSAADGEMLVTKVLTAYLQAVAAFLAAVFGTPLGFVLGFYFSKESDHGNRKRGE
jgi:hypothetical protein